MRRDAEKELILWKNQKDRYPLLVRGARQVGPLDTNKLI